MNIDDKKWSKISKMTLKSWVDAKDNTKTWRLGRIKKKTNNIVTISFDAWSDKHDIVNPQLKIT